MSQRKSTRRGDLSDKIQIRFKEEQSRRIKEAKAKPKEKDNQENQFNQFTKTYSLKPLKKKPKMPRPLNPSMSASGHALSQYFGDNNLKELRPSTVELNDLRSDPQGERKPSLTGSVLRAGASTPKTMKGRVQFLRSAPPNQAPEAFKLDSDSMSSISLESANTLKSSNVIGAWGEQFFTRDGGSLIEEWCESYRDENNNFESVAVFAELRLKEALNFMGPSTKPTRAVAAICCDLMLKICSLFGRYSTLMEMLCEQILQCVFMDYTKVMGDAATVNARVLYQCTPYFEGSGSPEKDGQGLQISRMPATMRAQIHRLKRNARASERLIRKTRFEMWRAWARRQKRLVVRCSGNPICKCFRAWKDWVEFRNLSWKSFARRHFFRRWQGWKLMKELKWKRHVLERHFGAWVQMFKLRRQWALSITDKFQKFAHLDVWGTEEDGDERSSTSSRRVSVDPDSLKMYNARQVRALMLLLRGAAHAKRHQLGAAHELLEELRQELGVKEACDAECQTDLDFTPAPTCSCQQSGSASISTAINEGDNDQADLETIEENQAAEPTPPSKPSSDSSKTKKKKRTSRSSRPASPRRSLRGKIGKASKNVPPLKIEQSEGLIATVYHEALKSHLNFVGKKVSLMDLLWMTLLQRFGIKSLATKYFLGMCSAAKFNPDHPRLSLFFSLVGVDVGNPSRSERVDSERVHFFLELMKLIFYRSNVGSAIDVLSKTPPSVPRDEVVKTAQAAFVGLSIDQPNELNSLIKQLATLPCYGVKHKKDQISIDEALALMMRFYEAEVKARRERTCIKDAISTIQKYARRYLLSKYSKKDQIRTLQKKFAEVDQELHGDNANGVFTFDEFCRLIKGMGFTVHPIMLVKLFMDWTDVKERIALFQKGVQNTSDSPSITDSKHQKGGSASNTEEPGSMQVDAQSFEKKDGDGIILDESEDQNILLSKRFSFLWEDFSSEEVTDNDKESALDAESSFGQEAATIAFAQCLFRAGFCYIEGA